MLTITSYANLSKDRVYACKSNHCNIFGGHAQKFDIHWKYHVKHCNTENTFKIYKNLFYIQLIEKES